MLLRTKRNVKKTISCFYFEIIGIFEHRKPSESDTFLAFITYRKRERKGQDGNKVAENRKVPFPSRNTIFHR